MYMYVCMYVCIHVYIHTYIHTCMHTYIYIYILRFPKIGVPPNNYQRKIFHYKQSIWEYPPVQETAHICEYMF